MVNKIEKKYIERERGQNNNEERMRKDTDNMYIEMKKTPNYTFFLNT